MTDFEMLIKHISGRLLWHKLKILNQISYNKVVVCLSNDNKELDKQVMKYLPDYMARKYVNKAIVFSNQTIDAVTKEKDRELGVEHKTISAIEMAKLYDYYCFYKFFDNIVFTYTDSPKDNLLGRFLRETDITEEDAACLALYHLRTIPNKEV